ncbi:MAG: YfiR family protein, partial [Terriglobales bacterium]
MAAGLVWTLVVASCLWAQGLKPTDYDVKAVYLYNFGRFVEWPASATMSGDSFNVCVLGQDPFGHALDDTLTGENIDGRSVTGKRISTPQEAVGCQILFISDTEDSRLPKIIEALNKGAVLTVSDMPQFSQRGGMIQFVLDGKKVRFEVKLT